MTKVWYKNFGWKTNPFDVRSNPNLVGLRKEKEKLANFVSGGNIVFLTGDSGTGKTSLLKWLSLSIKGHTPVYIDAEGLDRDFSLEDYLKQHRSLWRSFFSKYPKNIVVLLDEAQSSESELKNALKIHWDYDYIKSVVISQITPLDNFSEAFLKRIGNRTIKLGKIPKSDVFNLVDLRTGGKNPFSEEAVTLIAKAAEYNPRKLLESCEKVCIGLAQRGQKKKNISIDDVKEVLYMDEAKSKIPEVVVVDIGEKFLRKEELSPMQKDIMALLNKSDLTTQQLSNKLRTSEGSVGKQLSELSKLGKVRVVSEIRPKLYGLK